MSPETRRLDSPGRVGYHRGDGAPPTPCLPRRPGAAHVDFRLPDDVARLGALVREFVDREVLPLEQQIERENAVPRALLDRAAALGLFGITVPEAHGGTGLSALARSV